MFGLLVAGLSSTYTDAFTRADTVTVGVPGVHDWIEVGPWEIASNRVRRPGDPGANPFDVVYRSGVTADGFAECVPLSFLTGPVVRFDTTQNGGYMVYHNADSTRLVRLNPGAPTLSELGTSPDLADLATDSLAVEAVGSSIRAYLNGSLIIEATDVVWPSGVRGIITLDDNDQVEADNYAEGV